MTKITRQILTVFGWAYPHTRSWSKERILNECRNTPRMARDLRRIKATLQQASQELASDFDSEIHFENAEKIAEFIDHLEFLPNSDRRLQLEQWSDQEMVELLILSQQAGELPSSDTPMPSEAIQGMEQAMRAAIFPSGKKVEGATTERHPIKVNGVHSGGPFKRPMAKVKVRPSAALETGQKKVKSNRHWGVLGVTLSACILMTLLGYLLMGLAPVKEQAEDDPPAESWPNLQQKSPEENVGEDASEKSVPSNSPSRKSFPFELIIEPPRIVEEAPSTSPDFPPELWKEEPETVPQEQMPDRGMVRRVAVAWETIQGVVVEKKEPGSYWKLVRRQKSTSTTDETSVGVRSLDVKTIGSGWAKAVISAGDDLPSFGMVVANEAIISGEIGGSTDLEIVLALQHGGLGFQGVPSDVLITIEHQGVESTWRSTAANSSVQFEIVDGRLSVVSDAALCQFNGEEIAEPASWLLVDKVWIRRSSNRTSNWVSKPTPMKDAERRVVAVLEGEDDWVQGLLADRGWERPGDQELAIRWAINLDAHRAVKLAIQSDQWQQQKAALAWLLDPGRSPESVIPVIQELDVLWKTTSCLVPRWIAAMRGDSPVTSSLVLDMVKGLESSEPLFVRSIAKSMLETILGVPLNAYDPRRPNRQTINRINNLVRQQLRQNK